MCAAAARRGRALLLALPLALASLLASSELPGKDPPPLPGPAPQRRAEEYDPSAENARCETCHAEIAAEHRASQHKRSWEDPVFGAAYALEPLAFCRGCHAPESDPAEPPGAPARALGVGCVTCHVQDGEVVGARARAANGGAHAVRADARFSTAEACSRCHQFDFPLRPGAPMQDTVHEHKTGKLASTPCQACHMPTVQGKSGKPHKSHAFPAHGDAALLRSAVQASAARSTAQAVTVTLSVARVGHAFPTGDMFRRLEVRAIILGPDGEPTGRSTSVLLERKFQVTVTKQGTERVQVADTRLPSSGAPREALLLFAEDIERRSVRWEVAYQRMSSAMAKLFGVDPAADEVIVATGTLQPAGAPATSATSATSVTPAAPAAKEPN